MRDENFITELGGLKSKGIHFTRNNYIYRNENFDKYLKEYIDKCDNKDVYYCVYNYENENIDTCNIIGDFYLDFDNDELNNDKVFNKLAFKVRLAAIYIKNTMHVPEEQIHLYFSGSKGFHLIVPHEVFGIKPNANLNEDYKKLATNIAIETGCYKPDSSDGNHLDLGIYDRKRLFRLPNSINTKSGLYKVPVTLKQLYDFTYESMVQYASTQQPLSWNEPVLNPKASKAYEDLLTLIKSKDGVRHQTKKQFNGLPTIKKDLYPCVVQLGKIGVSKGERNNATFALAMSLFDSGYQEDEVTDIVLEWNETSVDPPLEEGEVTRTIRSAYSTALTGAMVGCTTYKQLGMCVGEKCRLLYY